MIQNQEHIGPEHISAAVFGGFLSYADAPPAGDRHNVQEAGDSVHIVPCATHEIELGGISGVLRAFLCDDLEQGPEPANKDGQLRGRAGRLP